MSGLAHKIPVTVVAESESLPLPGPGVALVTLRPPLHEHRGDPCPACAGRSDIRTLLFELIEESRQGMRPEPRAVLVDARAVDATTVIEAIEGRLAATALRDHTVARRFRLAG